MAAHQSEDIARLSNGTERVRMDGCASEALACRKGAYLSGVSGRKAARSPVCSFSTEAESAGWAHVPRLFGRRQSEADGTFAARSVPSYCRLLDFDWEQWGLPRSLNQEDRSNRVEVVGEGAMAKYVGSGRSDSDAAAVRANHPVPPQIGCYYYEATIVSAGRDGYISIGFAIKSASLSRLTGWEPGTIGYHADDGNLYRGAGTGAAFGPAYGTGDVVGCGIDFINRSFFFTKNGLLVGEVTNLKDKFHLPLFPCIGCRTPGELVAINLTGPFVFAIDAWIERRLQCHFPAKGNQKPATSNQIEQLILAHLVHGGWERSAQALARAIGAHGDQSQGGGASGLFLEQAFKVAKQRRRILHLIYDGAISEGLEHLALDYPRFFDVREHEDLRLELDCLRFAELVLAREQRALSAMSDSIQDEDAAELSSIMDLGRQLTQNHSQDVQTRQRELIEDCFALLAYRRPSESPLAYLFGPTFRGRIAGGLDEALLRYEGQPAQSPLHRLLQHSQALLDELQRLEDPEVALINL